MSEKAKHPLADLDKKLTGHVPPFMSREAFGALVNALALVRHRRGETKEMVCLNE